MKYKNIKKIQKEGIYIYIDRYFDTNMEIFHKKPNSNFIENFN